jgi:hypothetical protein
MSQYEAQTQRSNVDKDQSSGSGGILEWILAGQAQDALTTENQVRL